MLPAIGFGLLQHVPHVVDVRLTYDDGHIGGLIGGPEEGLNLQKS